MRLSLLLSVFLASFQVCQAQQDSNLSVAEFRSAMDTIKDVTVIDLRTQSEVKGGIIPNATIIDYFDKKFEARLDQLDKNKSYLLYCASGARSAETLNLMKAKGFKTVYHMDGGFQQWKSQKMPVTAYKKP
jgi:phage shock protein E